MRWGLLCIFLLTAGALLLATYVYKQEIALGHNWMAEMYRTVRLLIQFTVSSVAGGASLFVILAKRYGPKEKHWAYATIGTIIGYWLH